MGWIEDLHDALSDGEWPNGAVWPQGTPASLSKRVKFRIAAVPASVASVGIMLGLAHVGLPWEIGLLVGLVLGYMPLVVWTIVYLEREAKRQGRRTGR